MDFGYLAAILVLLLCMYEIKEHNNKVENLFPDETDTHQYYMRSQLLIPFVGHGLLLIVLIVFFVSSLIRG